MNDQERGGLIKLGLAAGLLYLFVTGGLANLVGNLTGGVSGTPKLPAFHVRDAIVKAAQGSPVASAGRL
jgi:hypothetical protein